jgi:hypothetical protein
MTETTTTLTETPDYYSREYHYRRFPANIPTGRGYNQAGHFAVWSRDVDRPNPDHVTWSPEIACLVAREYQTPEWHAEQDEKRSRPVIDVGDRVRLGDVVIEVPRRVREYVTGVPCLVIED